MLEINFALMKASHAAAKARELGMKIFLHHPCKSCGCEERYSCNGCCIVCSAESSRRSQEKYGREFLNNKTKALRELNVETRVRKEATDVKNQDRSRHALPKVSKNNLTYWNKFNDDMFEVFAVKYILNFVTGIEWQVDHVVALVAKSHWRSWLHGGEIACGVNAPCNMWVLPKRINLAKGCDFDEPLSQPGVQLDIPIFRHEDVLVECGASGVAKLAQILQYIETFKATGKLPQ